MEDVRPKLLHQSSEARRAALTTFIILPTSVFLLILSDKLKLKHGFEKK